MASNSKPETVIVMRHTENGIECREMTTAEAAKMSLKCTVMSIIKAKKHNLGYPQGYRGEEIMDFENDILGLRKEEEVVAFNALRNRLKFMRDGDRFTSGDVAFMANFMERTGVLKEMGLLEWSKQPCKNPVCQHDAAAKKEDENNDEKNNKKEDEKKTEKKSERKSEQ